MGALPEVPANQEGADQWKSKREATITSLQGKEINEKIPGLAEMLRQLKSLGYRDCPEKNAIVDQLEEAILSTPGHAQYYQEQIEQTRNFVKYYRALPEEEQRKIQEQSWKEEAARMSSVGGLTDRLNYNSVRSEAFTILGLLPSPETVAVLGHFLEDPEGRDGRTLLGDPIHLPGADAAPPAPNCGKAYFALGKLGIEHPPIPPTDMEDVLLDQDRVDSWKQWWNEVKTGKRTYRFKGSPIEYGADGPATKEQLERISMHQRMESDRETRHGKNSGGGKDDVAPATGAEPPPKPLSIAALIASCLMVAGAVGYYVRRHAKRA